jgi:hypothetical protein
MRQALIPVRSQSRMPVSICAMMPELAFLSRLRRRLGVLSWILRPPSSSSRRLSVSRLTSMPCPPFRRRDRKAGPASGYRPLGCFGSLLFDALGYFVMVRPADGLMAKPLDVGGLERALEPSESAARYGQGFRSLLPGHVPMNYLA